MNVNVNWDNVPASRWAEERINQEANRVARHLPDSANMHLRLTHEGQQYRTKVHVHALGRDWVAMGRGENLWEGLSAAFTKVMRELREFKSFQKDRIHRKIRGQKTIYF